MEPPAARQSNIRRRALVCRFGSVKDVGLAEEFAVLSAKPTGSSSLTVLMRRTAWGDRALAAISSAPCGQHDDQLEFRAGASRAFEARCVVFAVSAKEPTAGTSPAKSQPTETQSLPGRVSIPTQVSSFDPPSGFETAVRAEADATGQPARQVEDGRRAHAGILCSRST